jgi:rare lipoprotein A
MLKHYRVAVTAVSFGVFVMGAVSAQTPQGAAAEPAASTPAPAATPATAPTAGADRMEGLAAYYSSRLNGRATASGKIYDQNALTAAHPTLPFGTKVKVTNTLNNRSVVVTINDRGPTQPDRVVDVSHAAASRLGMLRSGLVPVKLEVVAPATDTKSKR